MASAELENAVTIEASSPLSADSDSSLRSVSSPLHAAARGVAALVDGSTPHLTGETRDLLRKRLRAASALFFGGFLAFWLREVLQPSDSPSWLFWVHTAVTIISGLTVTGLSMQGNCSLKHLRISELAVFVTPAILFLFFSYEAIHRSANLPESPFVPVIVVPWLMLMFTYALFIPNNWRRAVMVLTPMAVAPLAVIAYEHFTCAGYMQCLTHPAIANYETEQAMVMILALVTATVGVHTINNLRTAAFEARQLGQYRLKHRLGGGGMGEVFLAEHQMMKRPCAVKVIRPEKAGDTRTLARFEREVRSTAKLSHWNSIDIYDYGSTADGTFYYVMEYLPGHDLGELVATGGPLPASRAVYLFTQVCQALSEAHGMGLVHRDLKPANIFCSYRGGQYDVAKLLDFGLAKPTFTGGEEAALTQEGAITGSPMFMSPEQATGEGETDARSDIYALGAVMYHTLTGEPPFPHKQAIKVILAHVSEVPIPPREHNPDIPVEMEEIVLRCLEKDPDDRFQNVEALRHALADMPLADEWSSTLAAEWWNHHGCPERKAMAEAVTNAAAAGASCPWPSQPTAASNDASSPAVQPRSAAAAV